MADIRKPGPKFPPTRLLKASYEDIVPNGCHNEQVTKVLNELVHSAYFTNQSRPLQTTHPFESRDSSLCTRTERLKKALSEQISELDQSIRIQEEMMQQSLPYIKTLIHVSKLESSLTAVTLNCCSLATPTLSRVRQCGIVKCCKCSQRALPYTRFCTDRKQPFQLLIALNHGINMINITIVSVITMLCFLFAYQILVPG